MQFSLLYKLKRFEGLIWLLVLALYTQAMMPVQTHTQMVQDDSGRMVVVCTLEGTKTVQVGDDGQIIEVDSLASSKHDSAAWTFSDLMAAAAPFAESPQIHQPELNTSDFPAYYQLALRNNRQQIRSIRAPPRIS